MRVLTGRAAANTTSPLGLRAPMISGAMRASSLVCCASQAEGGGPVRAR